MQRSFSPALQRQAWASIPSDPKRLRRRSTSSVARADTLGRSLRRWLAIRTSGTGVTYRVLGSLPEQSVWNLQQCSVERLTNRLSSCGLGHPRAGADNAPTVKTTANSALNYREYI